MSLLGKPTLSGYTAFLRAAGIDPTVLPDNSPAIPISFTLAIEIVSLQLAAIACDVYTLAVYNFATDRLVNYAQDQPGQTFFGGGQNGTPPGLRQQYGINAFVAGVIQSSADEGTSQNIAVPESLKQLSLMDLQNLKTPWGRTYLQFAQQIGPSIWGLT